MSTVIRTVITGGIRDLMLESKSKESSVWPREYLQRFFWEMVQVYVCDNEDMNPCICVNLVQKERKGREGKSGRVNGFPQLEN